ncbi:Protein of unknown function [Pyronema omphalodes CBS 100304]|uniref:Uncharacterized protein n=1 Tax=Pyronema omphalodes (strain CBS 100304) TaxID=1076935 RepID=U4LRB2_PYROM|nr:Protein of unknown function [Pyronema omphalodes CBS 100304]
MPFSIVEFQFGDLPRKSVSSHEKYHHGQIIIHNQHACHCLGADVTTYHTVAARSSDVFAFPRNDNTKTKATSARIMTRNWYMMS